MVLDWLHLRWPAGTAEKLPEVRPDGATERPSVKEGLVEEVRETTLGRGISPRLALAAAE